MISEHSGAYPPPNHPLSGGPFMATAQTVIDYVDAIARFIRQLPEERASQLYDFARFL